MKEVNQFSDEFAESDLFKEFCAIIKMFGLDHTQYFTIMSTWIYEVICDKIGLDYIEVNEEAIKRFVKNYNENTQAGNLPKQTDN